MMRKLVYYGLILLTLHVSSQSFVEGVVLDEEEESIGFCHVYNRTMGLGKVSDINGRFRILVSKNDTLVFSYVGYQSLILPVSSIHMGNHLKVILPQDSVLLPSITIFADRELRVPLNISGAPIIIPGVSVTEPGDPIEAGDIGFGLSGVGGVPVPGVTLYGPITYFSKDEKERRKAEEVYKETRQTITYQKFIEVDSVRIQLKNLYGLNDQQYDQVIIRLHEQFPGIQKTFRPKEIWNWLLAHFDRAAPIVKEYYR